MPLVIAPIFLVLAGAVVAGPLPEYTLAIKAHAFQPDTLRIPANIKVKLLVRNEDATPEEFESTDFNREIVVLGHRSITVYVGPLHAGSYKFFGDFHRDTAQGRLIVE